jgi:hypothetical protein
MKRVVNVLDNRFGFGDFLRGSICLAQMTTKYNLQFKIYLLYHPFHICFNTEIIDPPTNVVRLTHDNSMSDLEYIFETFITSAEQTLYLSSNMFYDKNVTQDIKNIVNSQLNIKQQYIDELNKVNYIVLHIRSSDTNDINFDKLTYQINNLGLSKDTIVISSDYNIKKKLNELYGFYFMDNKPGHTAITTDYAELETTIMDYIILSRSSRTHCISYYEHGSGFSEQCSLLHNVPYTVTVLS